MHLPKVNDGAAQEEILSCWRLGKPISGGGRFYNIYRAAPKLALPDSNHDYVLKLINPDLPKELIPQAISRLGRESHVTERIFHPNVIRLLDAELDVAPFFLVQPWIYGRSLDCLLSQSPHLSLSRMLWVLRQTAEGVRAGHETGRVYLGMDPSHVLIGKTGRVTLIGWSNSHGTGEKVWLPDDQLQLARYAAPEVSHRDYLANPASDVYSLGVLIYHALAQSFPFKAQTVGEMVKAHQSQIPEDLVIAQPDCPKRLGSLVKQMISKNPNLRPSFRQVLNEMISIEIEFLSDETLLQL